MSTAEDNISAHREGSGLDRGGQTAGGLVRVEADAAEISAEPGFKEGAYGRGQGLAAALEGAKAGFQTRRGFGVVVVLPFGLEG